MDNRPTTRGLNEIVLIDLLKSKYRAPNCGFSRADRFESRRFSVGGEFRALPSTLGSGRKAGFGYGKRMVIKNNCGADAPPCNSYNIPSCFGKMKGGEDTSKAHRMSVFKNSPSIFDTSVDIRIKKSADYSATKDFYRHLTPGPRRSESNSY